MLRFPTLAELANETTPLPPAKPTTLFGMLGDPAVLFSDLLDNPGKYEEGVDELLQQLMNKQKDLGSLEKKELQMLDDAAVRFIQAPKKAVAQVPSPKVKQVPAILDEEDMDLDEHGAPMPTEIDVPTAPTFWWQR